MIRANAFCGQITRDPWAVSNPHEIPSSFSGKLQELHGGPRAIDRPGAERLAVMSITPHAVRVVRRVPTLRSKVDHSRAACYRR